MQYPNVKDLEKFLQVCEDELFNQENRQLFNYPSEVLVDWDAKLIKDENENILKKLRGAANVYAIFLAGEGESEFSIAYIGQTNSKDARARLTNHLIAKNEGTGAKLDKTVGHVQSGGKIKISWISIKPESIRHYVEEELISKYGSALIWNKHGKKKA